MKAVLLSNHYYRSSRKAGFHLLADALHKAGHDVAFVTTGLSWLSYARGDYRTKYKGLKEAHGKLIEERKGFRSYVHFTPWHPHTLLLPALDALTRRFMDSYDGFALGPLESLIQEADLILYESCNALFLFRKCKALAPKAKHVYRVSDDIRILRSSHPRLFELEAEIAPGFDLISVPCSYLGEKFAPSKNVRLHPHGVSKEDFEKAERTPYSKGPNCVFIGNAHLDCEFIRLASAGLPNIEFHIVGPTPKGLSKTKNVVCHGELPFADSIAYIKFADVGLYSLDISKSDYALSFTDSLKLKQYRHCSLPVVAPKGLDLRRDGVFYYELTPQSCVQSVKDALACERKREWADEAKSWDEAAKEILSELDVVERH